MTWSDANRKLRRRCRAAGRLAMRLLGAVMLGVAALLVVKARPDQHWSDPPIVEIVTDRDQGARSGGPPEMP